MTLPEPLFAVAGGLVVRELVAAEVPRLQALFDANPEYFVAVNGLPAAVDDAQTEFTELPPPHLSFGRRWVCGVFDDARALVGTVIVLSDLNVRGVWHIALFLVATALHGSGAAQRLHDALLRWMADGGARWVRLGVVAGNTRAERFWQRCGYREVRVRAGIDTGGRINDVRVLVLPLAADATIAGYLDANPRDRPGSTLP